MMVDPMFMIVQNVRLFLTAVTLNMYSKSWVFKLPLVFFTATLNLQLIGVTLAFC